MKKDPLRPFAAIGMITHHFEVCEWHLSETFQLLCEADNDAPFQAFGHIISSNLRLTMTKTALSICMPRRSAIRQRIETLLVEFDDCQTLRNRSIHQSLVPRLEDEDLAFTGQPLWHQTLRYTKKGLKPGQGQSPDQLEETFFRIQQLSFEMQDALRDLAAFLRRRRRHHRQRRSPGIAYL